MHGRDASVWSWCVDPSVRYKSTSFLFNFFSTILYIVLCRKVCSTRNNEITCLNLSELIRMFWSVFLAKVDKVTQTTCRQKHLHSRFFRSVIVSWNSRHSKTFSILIFSFYYRFLEFAPGIIKSVNKCLTRLWNRIERLDLFARTAPKHSQIHEILRFVASMNLNTYILSPRTLLRVTVMERRFRSFRNRTRAIIGAQLRHISTATPVVKIQRTARKYASSYATEV